MQNHSEHFLKQRRFYTFLPLVLLPFITVFYGVIVSKVNKNQEFPLAENQGLNTALPDAIINQDKLINKLSYYEKAAQDSAKRAQLLKKDPYFQDSLALAPATTEGVSLLPQTPARRGGAKRKTASDPKPEQVYKKLEALNAALSSASEPSFKTPEKDSEASKDAAHEQLEKQLQTILAQATSQEAETPESDPELAALSDMLDKIIQIQNPELAPKNSVADSMNPKASSVSLTQQLPEASLLQAVGPNDSLQNSLVNFEQNGFFSLDEPVSSAQQKAIEAVIDQNPRLVSGSTVKLKLSTDIFIQDQLIPKGSFLFGTASLSGERLNIQIQSVRHENALFTVNLMVYDLDGQPGIYIPGAITRDVAKQSASQASSGISMGTLDNSLGAQAADAAIKASKTLLSRKAKLQQVSIREGYKVLLYDKNGSGIVSR
ncbi:conjugative transposon protein TraM [Dyadobacter frigoris]|uniref:Conjugative transposon protein TraM n=1 Tax=Dyadobacter frigoris TaxID=2576211 RepID=A0A4U6CQL7_9BACT|nr:conjugative transposon protein TraM [Dyadobacter frigoris]TKT85741.1 conjugative transposon protein TraM [Dyadobacter frigoris]